LTAPTSGRVSPGWDRGGVGGPGLGSLTVGRAGFCAKGGRGPLRARETCLPTKSHAPAVLAARVVTPPKRGAECDPPSSGRAGKAKWGAAAAPLRTGACAADGCPCRFAAACRRQGMFPSAAAPANPRPLFAGCHRRPAALPPCHACCSYGHLMGEHLPTLAMTLCDAMGAGSLPPCLCLAASRHA
jgi:hypothetical protein